jgi:hypothetical protein
LRFVEDPCSPVKEPASRRTGQPRRSVERPLSTRDVERVGEPHGPTTEYIAGTGQEQALAMADAPQRRESDNPGNWQFGPLRGTGHRYFYVAVVRNRWRLQTQMA